MSLGNFGIIQGAVNMRCLKPPLAVAALIAAIRSVESDNDLLIVGYDWRPTARQNPANLSTFKGPTIGLGQIQEPRDEGNTVIVNRNLYTKLVQRSRCFPKNSNCQVLHADGYVNQATIRYDTGQQVQYLETTEGVGVYQKRADRLYRWAMSHALGEKNPPSYDVRSADMQNVAIYGVLALEKGLERNAYAALVGYNGFEPYATKVLSRVPVPQSQIDCLSAFYHGARP
ncbi:hypothetical protein [Gloeobacter kilaueensis]|uniref:Transglycosylase SLT domain-containing protein n=1 Tax=Gloeobacter kilaueensis (strain ATCC BAA-2537 / CCAP 1431/1 / ULC 316 / JS1) TaxID=1183438 RepID=U5QK20_GLOK1|nr:hypothetical protein [Gloeobacter kilaueensis]AGY57959.1 hypothetical protein GKIL_1713 [Gloeobacter kilaueensis JS1]